MELSLSLIVLVSLVSLVTSIGIAIYAVRQNRVPGAIPLAIASFAAATWTFGYIVEITSTSLPLAIFWDNFKDIGVDLIPLAIFLFALEYTGRKKWLTRRTYILLSIFPIVDWTITATNQFHGWLWSAPGLDNRGPFSVLVYTNGPWVWIELFYYYLLLSITLGLLLLRFPGASVFYRRQILMILVGIVIPWIGSAVTVFDWLPSALDHFDVTPVAFMLGNAVWAWGLFRYRLLDVVPIASETIVENMLDGVIVLDQSQRIVELNPVARRVLGAAKKQVIGQSLFDVWQQARQVLGETLKPSVQSDIALSVDGEPRHFEVRVSQLRESRRKTPGVIMILHDITDRQRAQNLLLESEQYARGIIDSSVDMIITTNNERQIVEFNEAAQKVFGYARVEILGTHIDQLYAQPDQGDAIRQALLTDGKFMGEVLNRRRNGEIFVSSLMASILRGARGEVLGVVGVSRDITETKRAEQARRRAEEKFQLLFNNAVEGMFQSTPEGRFISVNPALARMWGYDSSDDLIVSITNIGEQVYADPSRRADFRRLMDEFGEVLGFEYEALRKDGTRMWVSENARTVRDEDGALLYYEGSVEDITARKHGDAALQQRADEFAALYENTRDLAEVQDLSILLTTIVERAIHLLHTSGGGIYVYDAACDELEIKVATHPSIPIGTRLQRGEGMAGRVAQTRQPLIIDDYRSWEGRSRKYVGTTLTAIAEVPMLFGGELIGVLVVMEDGETNRRFNNNDTQLLSLFASQAASAIYNAQLYEKERHRAEEFAALYDITHDLSLQRDLPSLLGMIVERASKLLRASGGGIYLYDEERQELMMATALGSGTISGTRLKVGEGMAGQVAQSRHPLIVDDYSRWEHRSPQYAGIPIRAAVQVPMLYGGELIGVLAVHEVGNAEHKFTDSDAGILYLFAGHAASAVHDARLLDEARARSRRQETLYHLSTLLTNLRHSSELCQTVVEACREFLIYQYLGIFLLEPSTGDRILQAHYGWQNAVAHWRIHAGEGLSDKAIRTGELQYWRDVTKEPQYLSPHPDLHSELDVPVKAGDTVLGVLIVQDERVDAFGKDDFEILQAVANQMAVALENAQLYEEQKQLSNTDSLTGLCNRRYFVEVAQREFRRAHRLRSPCALLMLDLNDFKEVNDTFGHSAGDEALQLIAKTLAQHVRSIDVVARYGGDEFVVLLPDCDMAQAEHIAMRLEKESCALKFTVRDKFIPLGFSLGIAVATLEPEETLDELLSRADSEMYRAKGKRNR